MLFNSDIIFWKFKGSKLKIISFPIYTYTISQQYGRVLYY